jgi:UDP-galactopyranose mutase
MADAEEKVIFGGRLGSYTYYNMGQVIATALHDTKTELKKRTVTKAAGESSIERML